MAKITPSKRNKTDRDTVVVKTKQDSDKFPQRGYKWWKAESKQQMAMEVIATAAFLKEAQQYRYRQTSIYARMYGNQPLFNFVGSNINKFSSSNSLPIDRPTMNVVQSCVDTLVSRITQSRPRPVFLTDNGDYKERTLAKQLNNFMVGELYQTHYYELASLMLRDAAVAGTGCLKIFEGQDKRVMLERVLLTELLVDPNDGLYNDPRQLFQLKLIDREVLKDCFPEYKSIIQRAEQAYPEANGDADRTISDQVIVVEAWHLPSGPEAKDGKHIIACSEGMLMSEDYTKKKFPFVFLHYSPRMLGFWGQGLAETLLGTQVEINKLLMTISSAINLVGVPRVFLEEGSKVVKAHLNNQIGSIVTFRGTKPIYEVAPCMAPEIYAQLQRLVDYAYQQSGISTLAASAQKPAGLDSGAAMREYDDLQSDRFAALSKRYDNAAIEAAYLITDIAKDIAERDGRYETVYPNKNSAKQIDLPDAKLLQDPFVIQCFDASSLPRDPAGRKQTVIEMTQAGMITMQEGRRLLDYPDLEQVDKLANAAEERILQVLDNIIEEGEYTPPDPFMDLGLAEQLVTQYYNLYTQAKLEEEKAQMLRDFFAQIQALKQAAMPPPQALPGAAPGQAPPQALPAARPVSDVLPNAPPSGA